MIYSGRVAGSNHDDKGGGSNAQCLPTDPEYNVTLTSTQKKAYMFGAQFDNSIDIHNHDILCALCFANRSTSLMIPAKFTCPSGWTNEYHRYLMTSFGYQSRVEYICVDKAFRRDNREDKIEKGILLYPVKIKCNSLHCPPFNATIDMLCAQCTK